MYPGDLICLGFCDNSHLPSTDIDHAFEITYNAEKDTLLCNDGKGHLAEFFPLSPVHVPDNTFYGFTNEGGTIRAHKLSQSAVAAETESGITLAVVSLDPVSEAYLYRLGLDITVGRADSQGNLLTAEWVYRKNDINLPVRFKAAPLVGNNSIPVGLHTADIGAISVTTQNGEDFTITITRNDGSTLTAAWSAVKWRSYEPDIHTDWTDSLHPVLMLNDQVKQDVQRSLNNVEIEQTLDLNTSLLATTLTLHPNLGTPVTRTKIIDLTDLRIRWGNIIGTITAQSDLAEYITQRLLPYELLANKVTSITADSADNEYPSAKSVWARVEGLETRKEDKLNKTVSLDSGNKESETRYPSNKALYDYAVPREDIPAVVTGLSKEMINNHTLEYTKQWYDVADRSSHTETKAFTTDTRLLIAETDNGYELSAAVEAFISEAEPNWIAADPADGNLRVDVTEDLALKEDKANKTDFINDINKDDEAQYPSNKAVTEWGDARYIHTAGASAPQDPQIIETALDTGSLSVAGGITLDGFSLAGSENADALVLGDPGAVLNLEGSEERPGYNAETLALMSDVDLKQDKQTFLDNPATVDSPVYSVPDSETIRIEWNEVNRSSGAVTAKTQEIKTDETLAVGGTDTPLLGVRVENLVSQDPDNEIGTGADGKLFNLNSINKPVTPGYYLPILHYNGSRLEFTYFPTPPVDGTYTVQVIVTNGIPAWAIQ